MKSILVLLMMIGAYSVNAQKIKFKIEGQSDTTVNLVRYSGGNLYYSDTAEMKNGVVEFDGSKQKAGVLALFIPGENVFDFIYNGEKETYIEAKGPNYLSNATAKKSEENSIFFKYAQFMSTEKQKAAMLGEKRERAGKGTDQYEALTEEINAIEQKVKDRQNELAELHKDKLVGKIIKMSTDIEIPEPPVDEAGNIIDSNFQFLYFRNHYWDNIDLNDDRLVRARIFDNKLTYYFSKNMMAQHWDTLTKYAFDFIDRLDPKSEMFQYTVSTLTSRFEKSKIMGMNTVFIRLGEKYYCENGPDGKPLATWVTESSRQKLCEKVNTDKNLVMGVVPPNIKLRDTTDVTYHDFMSLDSDYTILYFWDPDCGHCKKITPKLQTLYAEKWRDRNIEIFAVGKASGEDFEKWKKFINKHGLEFINVGVTATMYDAATDQSNNQARLMQLLKETTIESLNYQTQYDIFSTPKVWVLDKNKKIIAYSLTISQLEDMLDRLQKKTDAKKLFPPEEDVENEQMH